MAVAMQQIQIERGVSQETDQELMLNQRTNTQDTAYHGVASTVPDSQPYNQPYEQNIAPVQQPYDHSGIASAVPYDQHTGVAPSAPYPPHEQQTARPESYDHDTAALPTHQRV
jgi:hypothetical protein